jgi:hypothetical protein
MEILENLVELDQARATACGVCTCATCVRVHIAQSFADVILKRQPALLLWLLEVCSVTCACTLHIHVTHAYTAHHCMCMCTHFSTHAQRCLPPPGADDADAPHVASLQRNRLQASELLGILGQEVRVRVRCMVGGGVCVCVCCTHVYVCGWRVLTM